jgi:hypothetical protein
MIEGREMLATLDLPGRHERNLRAPQWTLAGLLPRIDRLIVTCEVPDVLADRPRRKRAITCMDATTSILRSVDSTDVKCFASLLYGSGNLTRALATLQKDRVSEIAFPANTATNPAVAKLKEVLTAIMQRPRFNGRLNDMVCLIEDPHRP